MSTVIIIGGGTAKAVIKDLEAVGERMTPAEVEIAQAMLDGFSHAAKMLAKMVKHRLREG